MLLHRAQGGPVRGSIRLHPCPALPVLQDNYMEDIRAYRNIVQTADLRKPHQWFPVARALTRRIVYHAGPTNSGKTYNALVAMKASIGVEGGWGGEGGRGLP